MMNHSKGFSLIELMIVVALIGIISAVAMGYYGANVIAANRTEGRAAISATAGSLEKCKSLYGGYITNCNLVFPITTDTNYYSITVARTTATFTLTATPVAGQPQANDADCTTLTLTNTGLKGATGANTSDCW